MRVAFTTVKLHLHLPHNISFWPQDEHSRPAVLHHLATAYTGAMAAARVFAIGELVEAILLELPMKDLLFSQRINKQCKKAVDSSTRIQKALFLTPGNAEDTNIESTDLPEARSQFNPVPVGKVSAMVAEEWGCGQDSVVVVKSGVAFNTLLVHRLEFCWSDAGNACVEAEISPNLRKLPEYASCHRMLTTQPPIDFPYIKFYGTSREASGSGDFHLPAFLPESPEGTSLARLNETFERRAKQLKKCGVILVPSSFALVSTRY